MKCHKIVAGSVAACISPLGWYNQNNEHFVILQNFLQINGLEYKKNREYSPVLFGNEVLLQIRTCTLTVWDESAHQVLDEISVAFVGGRSSKTFLVGHLAFHAVLE